MELLYMLWEWILRPRAKLLHNCNLFYWSRFFQLMKIHGQRRYTMTTVLPMRHKWILPLLTDERIQVCMMMWLMWYVWCGMPRLSSKMHHHEFHGKYSSPLEYNRNISYPYAPNNPSNDTTAKIGMNKSRSTSVPSLPWENDDGDELLVLPFEVISDRKEASSRSFCNVSLITLLLVFVSALVLVSAVPHPSSSSPSCPWACSTMIPFLPHLHFLSSEPKSFTVNAARWEHSLAP